ncbi:hypothetical protein ES703_36689 [subsurface metagenome]
MVKIKDAYSKEELKRTLERVRDLFESESGFLFIYTKENNKITDLYHNVDESCVLDVIVSAIKNAVENDLLKGERK